jgi:hypothetical protein
MRQRDKQSRPVCCVPFGENALQNAELSSSCDRCALKIALTFWIPIAAAAICLAGSASRSSFSVWVDFAGARPSFDGGRRRRVNATDNTSAEEPFCTVAAGEGVMHVRRRFFPLRKRTATIWPDGPVCWTHTWAAHLLPSYAQRDSRANNCFLFVGRALPLEATEEEEIAAGSTTAIARLRAKMGPVPTLEGSFSKPRG